MRAPGLTQDSVMEEKGVAQLCTPPLPCLLSHPPKLIPPFFVSSPFWGFSLTLHMHTHIHTKPCDQERHIDTHMYTHTNTHSPTDTTGRHRLSQEHGRGSRG